MCYCYLTENVTYQYSKSGQRVMDCTKVLAQVLSVLCCETKMLFSQRQKLDFKQFFINISQPAWSIWNDGSCERDLLSHSKANMAWFAWKMAWFKMHLVQLLNFWTSNALICAKWHHLK
jgi:hypothetical protein